MSILTLKMNEEVWKKSINQVKPKWPGTVKHFIKYTYFAMTIFWQFWHVSNHLSYFISLFQKYYLSFYQVCSCGFLLVGISPCTTMSVHHYLICLIQTWDTAFPSVFQIILCTTWIWRWWLRSWGNGGTSCRGTWVFVWELSSGCTQNAWLVLCCGWYRCRCIRVNLLLSCSHWTISSVFFLGIRQFVIKKGVNLQCIN